MSKLLKLPTLLVVAENPTVRFWIKKHLEDQFFILAVETKSEALSALVSRLDFIIVDAAMEECDALELCKELRNEVHLVPILLVTGRLKKSFREKAYESGVTDFLSDQLDVDELKGRIASGLKTATAREKTTDIGLAIKPPAMPFGTSLKNKMVLNDQGLKILADAKKERIPLSLLFIQIDGFDKWENREEIFRSLGQFIQNLLREKDVLIPSTEGRYILLLYNTFPEAGKKVAERLREKINDYPFSAIRKLTVTIAVSSLEASEGGFQKMIDSALKSIRMQTDTNRIITFDEEVS